MIRVALFDLDDTLFDHTTAVRAAVLAHRTALSLEGDEPTEWGRWHALEEHHYHRYLAGEIDFFEQRRERMRDFMAPFGRYLDDANADALYESYFEHYAAAWVLHADTIPCLDALGAAGVRVGLITNGEREFQQRKVTATGLDTRVERLVASGDYAFAKPDHRIFETACEIFGVRADESAYVGDRFETDALGAAAAGLTGVWLDRPGRATSAELARAASAGVHVIRSLAELPQLVATRGA